MSAEKYSPILAACDIGDFDRDKRNKYDTDMYDEKRRKGEIAAALEMGEAAGMAKGMEKGRESAKLEDAAKFKALGVAVEIISQATGLSLDVIDGL